jgi:hypothetical protein
MRLVHIELSELERARGFPLPFVIICPEMPAAALVLYIYKGTEDESLGGSARFGFFSPAAPPPLRNGLFRPNILGSGGLCRGRGYGPGYAWIRLRSLSKTLCDLHLRRRVRQAQPPTGRQRPPALHTEL